MDNRVGLMFPVILVMTYLAMGAKAQTQIPDSTILVEPDLQGDSSGNTAAPTEIVYLPTFQLVPLDVNPGPVGEKDDREDLIEDDGTEDSRKDECGRRDEELESKQGSADQF
ncbi:hypothetical protein UPYG_G00095140 [Umbra pygmaea]|uniref:Uncharacterized protein n=1 Tax=Umbra pygmaea TaxID=75934 RepID=A0ABD0WZP8_UMBPY